MQLHPKDIFHHTQYRFSIWMTVFANDIDMRKRFIQAFEGTESAGCFDAATTHVVSPAPNPDTLLHGGKI